MRFASRPGGATRVCAAAGLALLVTTWLAQPAFGIPAFARKYGTSCHTCHTVYPKLNPFGSAFRLNGYRMPGETEDMVKQEQVRLGADANRRLWPEALWPSTVPSHVPLSLDLRLASVSEHDAETNATTWNDFRFPEELELLAGGTFGDSISYFATLEAEVETGHDESGVEVGIGHAEIRFNGLAGGGSTVNVKLGRFTPEISQQFNHGYLAADSVPASMFGFNPIGFHGSAEVGAADHHGGGGGIAVPAGVDGIEVFGILAHRFEYSAGVANGMGPGDGFRDGNEAKDVYAGISYKFGGMSLDGEGGDYEASAKNWREKSLRVGVFGYEGDGGDLFFQGSGHHSDEFVEDREFNRYGFHLNGYYQDLNIIVGYVTGEDTLAGYLLPDAGHGDEGEGHDDEEDDHGEVGDLVLVSVEDFEYEAYFTEADLVIYPWLHAAVRYEWLDPSNPRREDFERYVINLSALVRANVKALVEYREDIGGEQEDDYELVGALRFAF